jgi:hypothetical protein
LEVSDTRRFVDGERRCRRLFLLKMIEVLAPVAAES